MKKRIRSHCVGVLMCATAVCVTAWSLQQATAAEFTVKATNRLPVARSSETLEVALAQLAALGAKDAKSIHIKTADGTELVCQPVDTDFDAYRKPDVLIFQSDFGPNETKTFTLLAGKPNAFTRDQFKAFGRFVRERFDDFAWENDRIAHRMYGKGLETWAGEPLTSSTVDIWSKRTARMVISDWYMADDYHADHSEGADFYSAGPSRGCGGSGLWAAEKLWTSKNFINSRVLANGPIRVVFELDYEPFEVDGRLIRETKRISLDAGSQLDKFQSTYKWEGTSAGGTPIVGVGIKKTADAIKFFDADKGILCVWEKVAKNGGMQGIGVVAGRALIKGEAGDKLNYLVLLDGKTGPVVTYCAGFCWDKAGMITTAEAWRQYLAGFEQGLRSPIEVELSEE